MGGVDKLSLNPPVDNKEREGERKCLQLNNDHKTYQDGRIYSTKGLSIALNARGNNGWYTDEKEL